MAMFNNQMVNPSIWALETHHPRNAMEEFSRRGGHLDAACLSGMSSVGRSVSWDHLAWKSLGKPSGKHSQFAIEHGHLYPLVI